MPQPQRTIATTRWPLLSLAWLGLVFSCAPAHGQNGTQPSAASSSSPTWPAQLSPVSENAPKDQPTRVNGGAIAALHRAVASYVAQAKASYPQAKARYLAGLPANQHFYVTTTLHGVPDLEESAFIEVTSIKDGMVTGLLATRMQLVRNYRAGQVISIPESSVEDWTITYPDGHEEGNVVGKFLDTYQAPSS